MATKRETEKTITLTVKEAEKLLDLYSNIEAADAHYQRCQSDSFRQFVQQTYKAANVCAAYERLNALFEAATAQPETPQPETPAET